MTRIAVDPDELSATATLVRSSAGEVADVGAALGSCVCCAAPPEVEVMVTQIVATADRVLDLVAQRLNSVADDLVGRAGVAAQDSLTVASTASSAAVVTGGAVVGGTTPWSMTGPDVGTAVFGGASVIGGATIAAGAPLAGGAVVGGASTPTPLLVGPGGAPADMSALLGGSVTIGGPAPGPPPSSDVRMVAPDGSTMSPALLSQLLGQRAGGPWNPRPPAAGLVPMVGPSAVNALWDMSKPIDTLLLPSRSDLSNSLGRYVSSSEYDSRRIGGVS